MNHAPLSCRRLFNRTRWVVLVLATVGLGRCHPSDPPLTVRIHLAADPVRLQPYQYAGEPSEMVIGHLFQPLLGGNPQDGTLLPVLAADLPQVTTDDSLTYLTYQLRPEARWDDGRPVTAADVAFSLKALRNPCLPDAVRRATTFFIRSVRLHADDDLRITFVCRERPLLFMAASGDFEILSEALHDPTLRWRNISLAQLDGEADTTGLTPVLRAMTAHFTDAAWRGPSPCLRGSGPYELVEWRHGERLTLRKKAGWWGDRVAHTHARLSAVPEHITFQVINDYYAAVVALKNRQLDFMRGIPEPLFAELEASEEIRADFYLETPPLSGYNFVGINVQHPALNTPLTRQALAHLVDYDYLLNVLQRGRGRRTSGPYDPQRTSLPPDEEYLVKFDPARAAALLAQDGWRDLDHDGVLERTVGNETVPMRLEYKYNVGNEQRRAVGLLLQETGRALGVQIVVRAEEWGTFLESLQRGNFDLYGGAFSLRPHANDYTQTFHSRSVRNGSNYLGYSDVQTDCLLDAIRAEAEAPRRDLLYARLYARLRQQAPMIFLYIPFDRVAVNRHYQHTQVTGASPGCWPASFTPVAAREATAHATPRFVP